MWKNTGERLNQEPPHCFQKNGKPEPGNPVKIPAALKVLRLQDRPRFQNFCCSSEWPAILNYSRSFETEADLGASELLKQQGFSRDFLVQAFRSFENNEAVLDSAVPQYFSTHPDLNERIKNLENQNRSLESSGPGKILNPQSWKELKNICANVNSP